MEAKHTPGPWVLFKCWDGFELTGTIANGRPFVATLPFGEELVVSKADATLIAAAPELLEALASVVAALTQPVQTSPEANSVKELAARVEILRGDCSFAVKVARAAIAKAKGE